MKESHVFTSRSTRIAISVLLTAASLVGVTRTSVATMAHARPVIERKNVLDLTVKERRAFVDAVLQLKRTPSPHDSSISWYDQFVAWHVSLYRCGVGDVDGHGAMGGHMGSLFLPWHRVFVHQFEQALNEVSGRPVAVPYWDWTDPASRDAVFADDFMGGDGDPKQGYAVVTGPFRKGAWTPQIKPEGLAYTGSYQPHLVRKRGADPLPVPLDDVAWALQRPVYDAPPYDATADVNQSFRNALEGWWRVRPDGSRASDVPAGHCGPDGWMVPGRDGGELHNQVHTWTAGIVASPVGPTTMGTMLLSNSPSDPVFFLHHANVDRLWAKWQALHRDAGFEPAAHGSMAMEPFSSAGLPFSPHDVLETTDLGYTYADRVDSDDVPVPPAR